MIQILGLSGSLRQASFNTAALHAAQAAADDGTELTVADLSEIPLYDQGLFDQGLPPAVERLGEQIAKTDALLFATPEYNYFVPGVLKNAIDWVSRLRPQPMAGKPAAIVSASMGQFGGARAQYHLRQILVCLDVHCLNKPEVMIAQAHERFGDDGTLVHAPTRDFMASFMTAFDAWIRRIQTGRPQ